MNNNTAAIRVAQAACWLVVAAAATFAALTVLGLVQNWSENSFGESLYALAIANLAGMIGTAVFLLQRRIGRRARLQRSERVAS